MTQVESVERRGGRPRSEDADRAIINAVLDLLAEEGVSSMTIEGIAARAGVGKTTVYRRWPNKEALIVDAMAELKGPVPELPGRSLREDLMIMFEAQVRSAEASRRHRIYACFAAERSRNSELSRRYAETVLEPRHEAMREAIRAAIRRGEVREDVDVEAVRQLLTAPMLVLFTWRPDETPDADLVTTFFDMTMEGIAAKPV